jgi:hypothetical protein
MNLKFNQSNFNSEYWQSLNKLGLPYYLYLGDELVIITNIEKRKRKKGATIRFITQRKTVEHYMLLTLEK